MQGLPAPPPSIGYDVNEFRKFFKYGLDQLKYNNKYIINDLTTLASVYHHRMSTYIVKDIEQHIRMSHPAHRLVGFYVLDSICKNLGHPFPQLFKPFIERLFLIAYRDIEDVDPSAKIKFEELLGTWRTGSANQTELFDPDIQRRIEEGVFGSWRRGNDAAASQAFLSGIKQQPAIATPVEKASILYEVRRILSEREQIASLYPADQANLAQMATLQQLEQVIASQQLTLNQVDDIRKQLQPLKAPTLLPPPIELGVQPSQMQTILPPVAPPTPIHPSIPNFLDSNSLANITRLLEANPNAILQALKPSTPIQQAPLVQQQQPILNFDLANQLFDNQSLISQPHQPQIAQPQQPQILQPHQPQISHPPLTPSAPQLAQVLASTNMFDSQKLAAALAYLNSPVSNGVPSEAGTQERPVEPIHQHSPAPSTLSTSESVAPLHTDPAVMEYENMIAGLPIELQSSSINRVKAAEIADILYSNIPQFCRQDGSRFLHGKVGSQRASEQLDRHFRLQRRARESAHRAQQRMWAQSESEWLESHDFGTTSLEDPSNSEATKRKKRKAADEEKSVSELSKKSIIRPSSPGLASQPCPICQESFETRFDEDEGEFYWSNAIEMTREAGKPVVYHATCHYETLRNKARMKMKTELEENRLKRIQAETERKTQAENGISIETKGLTGVSAGGGSDGKNDDGGSSSCNNDKPVGSTGDDGDKCLLQVDETFYGESEITKIKLEPTDDQQQTLSLSSDLPVQVVNDDDQKEEKGVQSKASFSLLGKRKSSPIGEEIDPVACDPQLLGLESSEGDCKKLKLS